MFAALLDDLTAAPVYRTDPVSPVPQAPYLNTVLVGSTATAAADLLAVGKALERAAGRSPGPRHAPRPLDVDLLLWDDVVSHDSELRLPHPGLRERRFVLAPLCDVEPHLALPPDGRTVSELLATLPARPAVERLGPWLDERRL